MFSCYLRPKLLDLKSDFVSVAMWALCTCMCGYSQLLQWECVRSKAKLCFQFVCNCEKDIIGMLFHVNMLWYVLQFCEWVWGMREMWFRRTVFLSHLIRQFYCFTVRKIYTYIFFVSLKQVYVLFVFAFDRCMKWVQNCRRLDFIGR